MVSSLLSSEFFAEWKQGHVYMWFYSSIRLVPLEQSTGSQQLFLRMLPGSPPPPIFEERAWEWGYSNPGAFFWVLPYIGFHISLNIHILLYNPFVRKQNLCAIEQCTSLNNKTKDEWLTWTRIWKVFDKKTSDFVSQAKKAKQGPANELAERFVCGADVESCMVSNKCLKANLVNARITTNLRVGVCDFSHKQLIWGPFSALCNLWN